MSRLMWFHCARYVIMIVILLSLNYWFNTFDMLRKEYAFFLHVNWRIYQLIYKLNIVISSYSKKRHEYRQ